MTALLALPRNIRRACALAALLVVVVPCTADASVKAIYQDCLTNGHLTKSYSQKDYSDALANAPTDAQEYSDCVDQIRRAQLASVSGGSGGGGGTGGGGTGGAAGAGGTSGGSGGTGGGAAAGPPPANVADALAAATPQDRAAVQQAMKASPTDVDGKPIDLNNSKIGSLDSIPTPLLIVLAVLALAAAASGTSALTNRVRRRPPAV